jgi:hypothetical protein
LAIRVHPWLGVEVGAAVWPGTVSDSTGRFNESAELRDGPVVGLALGALRIGFFNVFDTYPPVTNDQNGHETLLYDPRGRMIYANLKATF